MITPKKYIKISVITSAALLFSGAAHAADSYQLTIKDHVFSPAELVIPANQKITINVKNLDATPEEFDSSDLNREKVLSGGSEGVVLLGPLAPGTYNYMGEFHSDTAHGAIIVK